MTEALRMPSNYVLMGEEEMMYIDGGGDTMFWVDLLEYLGISSAAASTMLAQAGYKVVSVVGRTISVGALVYFGGTVTILSAWVKFLMKYSSPGAGNIVYNIHAFGAC
ncbi:MAG: hypothetical protein VB035_14575 [Candidatus Fimivivens sp.]|nr:hypothetical protein [Candidatus Fimivivens sp.]